MKLDKSVLQDLFDACEEVLTYLDHGQCPLCFAYSADEGHDNYCPALQISEAISKAKGEI